MAPQRIRTNTTVTPSPEDANDANPEGVSCVVDWALEFAAVADGEATPEGIERLAEHISQCDGCRVQYVLLLNDVRELEKNER